MRDGYYLSTYISIDKLLNLGSELGRRHDQNIALWKKNNDNIELVHYWELERQSGLKHHSRCFYDTEHAKEIINSLLAAYNLSLDDMVEVWGTPELASNDDYHSIYEYPDLPYHSIAHLFSALMFDMELFSNSTIIGLAVDGGPDCVCDLNVGEKNWYAGGIVRNGIVDLFPIISPGRLWEVACDSFKLQEGTLMALAEASKSEAYIEEISPLNLSNEVNKKFADKYVTELYEIINGFEEKDMGIKFNYFDPRFSIEDNKISMAMKIIQRLSVKMMEKTINEVVDKFGINTDQTYLALSGGYALNCPTNSYLMTKYKFKGFLAPPCVNDSGVSLGIGLYAFYKKMGKFNFKLQHAFYGDRDENLDESLELFSKFVQSTSELDELKFISDLEEAPIVWFDGAAEIGPRALGNRSIIADPRKMELKDQVNRIKQREWWRPVAPIILEEDVGEWFENSYPSSFMLHTFKIKENRANLIPAVLHLDGSARIQTINDTSHKALYKLVKAFKLATGVPIICNTSLNDKGEPVINKINEAMNFALRKGIKVIYINCKRIELTNHEMYLNKEPLKRILCMDKLSKEETAIKLKELNPHNITSDIVEFYYFNPSLIGKYDLTKKSHVRELSILKKIYGQ